MEKGRRRGGNKRASKANGSKEEARVAEKKNAAARRKELLVGLGEEDKREMVSFMGSVNGQARNTLQGVVRMLSSSGQDPRLLIKKTLVHALANLDIDMCISTMETMLRLGQDGMLQLLWLYERYNVPNAGGGMTKCAVDHFGRNLGVGKVEEIFRMSEEEKEELLLQLADWNPIRKLKLTPLRDGISPPSNHLADAATRSCLREQLCAIRKVMKAWEATDPTMTAGFLLDLVREEQARGEGPGNLWQCSLCPVKRNVEAGAKMKRGEHRRKDRTIDAGSLYDYGENGRGKRPDVYFSPHESLFQFTPQQQQGRDENQEQRGRSGGAGGSSDIGEGPSGFTRGTPRLRETKDRANQEGSSSNGGLGGLHQQHQQEHLRVTYAGKGFDPRRMCGGCTEELRAAILSSGHDLEVWHTVDHERRALVTKQRQNDVLKARWAERERKDRQVSELLRFICEANLDAFSRHSLEDRAKAAHDIQAAEVRRMLDLKLSNVAAVKAGAIKDDGLKRLNEREANAWAAQLRLKAALNMDRHYASLAPGGLPASRRRRHPTSTKPSDFLEDGTPATPQGATQTFGRTRPPEDDNRGSIRRWKGAAEEAEEVLGLRRDVREWQTSHGSRARFSYLCERWVGAASDIEAKQMQRRLVDAAEREKRMKERQAAKLLRKRQLAELRDKAGSRATGEEKRKVERDKEAEERKRWEGEELVRMRHEEAAQLSGGDRYWGLVCEMQRLRVIEEERRIAWEKRIRATREKMVAVRCISELSDFTYASPPRDPELQQQIDRLMEI